MVQPRKPLVTKYRVLWTLAVFSFTLAVFYVFDQATTNEMYTTVDSDDVQITWRDQNPPSQSIEEDIAVLELEVEGAELSVRSAIGDLVMHVWAEKATKHGRQYEIAAGKLLFVMQDRQTLLISVTDCSLDQTDRQVTVSGSISGHIIESGQYFEASELTWQLDEHVIRTGEIRLIGRSVEVLGEGMTLDLETGTVNFEGLVKASV